MLPEKKLENLSDTMFAALIDGLRLKDRRIKQNYLYAFVAIGSGAIPRLESAIEHGRPRAVRRQAIEGAIAKARNGDYERYWTRGEVPQSRVHCVLLALLNGLRADDARHHELVTAALRAAGRDIVSLLVMQAGMVDQLMPEWCVRLLVAAEHVGAAQPRNQTPHPRGNPLPQRGLAATIGDRTADGTKPRMGDRKTLRNLLTKPCPPKLNQPLLQKEPGGIGRGWFTRAWSFHRTLLP